MIKKFIEQQKFRKFFKNAGINDISEGMKKANNRIKSGWKQNKALCTTAFEFMNGLYHSETDGVINTNITDANVDNFVNKGIDGFYNGYKGRISRNSLLYVICQFRDWNDPFSNIWDEDAFYNTWRVVNQDIDIKVRTILTAYLNMFDS